ncbi:MAG: hypothetical protein CMD15_06990 [Flavobacteriales bacterium]|nr:hypothetical protein [Flavobacteriales bacterium]
MKRIFGLLLSICFCVSMYAQQLPQISQYMNNNYAINPAIAGMYDYYQVNTTIRNQWVGVNDAPRTNLISIYGRHNKNIGLGGIIYNDVTGPTSRIGSAVSYTYKLSLNKKIDLSFALQGGFTQFKIIKDLQTEHVNDPLLQGGDVVRTLPDATFGINLSGSNWYFGAALPQLLSSELNLMDDDVAKLYDQYSSDGKLARHIYILGSYKHKINSLLSLEPNIFVKAVEGAATQVDFGVKTQYKDLVWFGANYQLNNDLSSLAVLLGYNINNRFNIGYSYGLPTSSYSSYYSGSHEFMLGVKLVK